MNKLFIVLIIAGLAGCGESPEDAYDRGHEDGYREGYEEGQYRVCKEAEFYQLKDKLDNCRGL